MYRHKEIDGEWVVVDDSGEIVNSEVDGRISAIAAANRMNREENNSDLNVKIHRGNSYGNTSDDDDLNEESSEVDIDQGIKDRILDASDKFSDVLSELKKITDDIRQASVVQNSDGDTFGFKLQKQSLSRLASFIENRIVVDLEKVQHMFKAVENQIGLYNDSLDESTDYYTSQIARLKSGPNMEEYAIQIRDNEGNKTNWMNIHRPALDKIKSVLTSLNTPEEQRMNDNGNSQEVKEAFGKESKISKFDAYKIMQKFDNKDFFTLSTTELSELSDLKKKYKYRQSKLSGQSGRSELRSFYYYLEKLAKQWETSPNNRNNESDDSIQTEASETENDKLNFPHWKQDKSIDQEAEEIPKALMNGKHRIKTKPHGDKDENEFYKLLTGTGSSDPESIAKSIFAGAGIEPNDDNRIETLWGSKTFKGAVAMIKRFNNFRKSISDSVHTESLKSDKDGKFGKLMKQYRNNEKDNYHTENIVLLAKAIGDKEDREKARQLEKQYKKDGHLTSEVKTAQNALNKKLWPKFKAAFDAENKKSGDLKESFDDNTFGDYKINYDRQGNVEIVRTTDNAYVYIRGDEATEFRRNMNRMKTNRVPEIKVAHYISAYDEVMQTEQKKSIAESDTSSLFSSINRIVNG